MIWTFIERLKGPNYGHAQLYPPAEGNISRRHPKVVIVPVKNNGAKIVGLNTTRQLRRA